MQDMITIVIDGLDEEKAKEILSKITSSSSSIHGALENPALGSVIRLIDKKNLRELGTIKDKVIELEDSWYEQKRGLLYKAILDEVEKPLIEHTLKRTEGNQLKAARMLGINRNTMRAKIKKLGIDPNKWKT